MSHSYDVSADSPATDEQIHAAYGREWRPAAGGKLEKSYAAGMAENIAGLQRLTATWIEEHM